MKRYLLIIVLFINMIALGGYLMSEIRYSSIDTALPRDELSLKNEEELALGVFTAPKKSAQTALALLNYAEGSSSNRNIALCAAAKVAEAALVRAPADPQLHLLFAAIWRVGSEVPCLSRFSSKTVDSAVRFALGKTPYHPMNNLRAAQWFLARGKEESSILALRRFTSGIERTTRREEAFVVEQFDSEELFHRIVPSSFPQIIKWSSLLKKQSEEKFDAWQVRINEKIAVALARLEEDLEKKRVSPLAAQQYLLDCYALQVLPRNWSRIDQIHSRLAGSLGQRGLASYLNERAGLLRVPVIAGVRKHDLRPESGELTNWGSIEQVRLGESSTSVGLFIPKGWKIRLIEIYPGSHGMNLNRSGIRVFVSRDNDRWIAIDDPVDLNKVTIDKQSISVLRYKSEYFPYVKVLYSSGHQDNSVANRLVHLFRVYGLRG